MEISRTFTFDAAHHLTNYYGKCEQPHGHTYTLTVTVSGPVQPNGLTVDFHLLKKVVEGEILEHFDHRDLNDIFENPSAENISMWMWDKLNPIGALLRKKFTDPRYLQDLQKKYLSKEKKGIAALKRVLKPPNFSKIKLIEIRLCETPNSCVIYRGR